MQDRVFYIACLGFIGGVFFSSFVFFDLSYILFLSLISFFIILFFNFISNNKWGIICSVFIFAISLGLLRFYLIPKDAPDIFSYGVGEIVSFQGFIVDEPDIRKDNQKIILKIENNGEETKVLVTTDFLNNFNYGDKINVKGKLEKPENFTTVPR